MTRVETDLSVDNSIYLQDFEKAYHPVRRRIVWVAFLRYLRSSWWILALSGVVVVSTLRLGLGWNRGEWLPVVLLVGFWVAVGVVLALFNAPSGMRCLRILDEVGDWRDRFSSAWAFLGKDSPSPEELAHVRGSVSLLRDAVQEFPKCYESPQVRGAILAGILLLALALLPVGRLSPDASDVLLTPAMQDAAAEQAAGLRTDAKNLKAMGALSEVEKSQLEELRVEVEGVADSLAAADGLTAGEMLEALEARARAAEKLAERLGLTRDDWASPEMLKEMGRHADTANLALTIEDKVAEDAAIEAMNLSEILDQEGLRKDIQDRVTSTLEQVVAAATPADEERPVGERFGNALRKLSDAQAKTAAREFEELAKHFRFLAQRNVAREKLNELAANLREAGAEVSGSELERLEQIANETTANRAAPSGLQAIESGELPDDLEKMLTPQLGSSGAEAPAFPGQKGSQPNGESGKTPVPGMAETGGEDSGSGEKEGSMALSAPVPGEPPPAGESGGSGQSTAGSGQAQNGKGEGGMLSAPIPGQEPGEPGAGSSGMSLAGNPGAGQGQGGNEAGTGTAAMIDNQTESLDAAQDGEVVAQVNADGESTVRAVEGQARREGVSRSRQEIVAEFLSVEEQALDGKSIPLSRRDHVIRYFSAIRRQFEESETEP